MRLDGARNLHSGQHETARRVQDEFQRLARRGFADGLQYVLGVVQIDVAQHRNAKQAHGLLPVDNGDNPAFALFLNFSELVDEFGVALLIGEVARKNKQ